MFTALYSPTGIAIFVIVFLNAGIAAVTENVANNSLEALAKMSNPSCNVIRDGQEIDIPSTNVVVGDVIVLGVGKSPTSSSAT